MKKNLPKHAAICIAIMLCFTLMSIFSSRIHIGFFGNLALLVFGSLFTTLGVALGDAFRRFTMPDLYVTTGAVDTFHKKIFWMVGPQCVGWFLGLIACNGLMKNVFGYPSLFA